MDDSISRQDAIDALRKDIMGGLNYESILKALPTADVRENIKANFVIAGYKRDDATHLFKCSVCGGVVDFTDNFCKHCGACFRGGDAK